jgi:hypothetical protein
MSHIERSLSDEADHLGVSLPLVIAVEMLTMQLLQKSYPWEG